MKLEEQLLKRSEHKCELCGSDTALKLYEVPPQSGTDADNCIMICNKCLAQIEKKEEPAPAVYKPSVVRRKTESSTTEGFGITYIDEYPDGKSYFCC